MRSRRTADHAPRARAAAEIRRARAEDLAACARVFAGSSVELATRLGQTASAPDTKRIEKRLGHLLATDPAGFHVLVRSGRVVAFASTILRERVHFLSMFWALPGFQESGLGRELVRRAFDEPGAPRGTVRCVYASLDPRAQRLYLDLGMLPRTQVYVLGGAPEPCESPAFAVELEPLGEPGESTRRMLDRIGGVDRFVRGCRRDVDQRFELSQPGARAFIAKYRGRPVGYVSLDDHGSIGPGAVRDPRYAAGLAWAALAMARELGVERVRMRVPGLNGAALRVALASRLRISLIGAWMAEREIGHLDRYLGTFGDLF